MMFLMSVSRCIFRDLFRSNTGPIVKESMAKGEARYETTQVKLIKSFVFFLFTWYCSSALYLNNVYDEVMVQLFDIFLY